MPLFEKYEDTLFNILEEDEEHRHDEQQGDSADNHAADGAHAERLVAIGSYARG